MAIKKVGDRWQVRWRDNTRRQRARSFTRKQDAIDFEHDTLAKLKAGTWVDPDRAKITVEAWARRWLDSAHNIRRSTRQAYQRDLAHILPVLGHLQLGQVTDAHIDRYLKAQLDAGDRAPATIRHEHQTLRRLFRLAVNRGRLPASPAALVEAPRVPRPDMVILTAAQLEQLADTIDDRARRGEHPAARYRTLILVAGWGGPRWGELAALRVRRVDVERNRIKIEEAYATDGVHLDEPKTDAGRRWVSIPASVMAEVADHIAGRGPDDLVWVAPGGGVLRHNNFGRRILHPACVRAGLGEWVPIDPDDPTRVRWEGLTPHDLRHTSVALAIADGAHPKAIQARMGHSSIVVTLDRYGHLFPDIDEGLAGRLDDTRARTLSERRRLRVV